MALRPTRREFLQASAAVLSSSLLGRSADALSSSREVLREYPYGAVTLTGGPLQQQYDRIHASYLALDNDRLLKVYRQRAGLPSPGRDMGGWYDTDGFVPGHALGQYISGLARIGATTGDPACATKVAANWFVGLPPRWARIINPSSARKPIYGSATPWISISGA